MHESTAVTKRPARIVLSVGIMLALATFAFVVLVPRWIKSKIIAAAAAQGVALTIGDLAIAPGHARLKNVTADALIRSDAKGAPKASAKAALVDVTLDWITPTAIDVTGMHITLDSSIDDLRAALASRSAPGGSAATITRVGIKDASLEWTRALPIPSIVIEGDHIDGDITKKPARALGEDFHVHVAELRATAKKDLPAWSATLDRDETGTRLALSTGTAAKISIASDASGLRALDVDTKTVTLGELGLPSESLGLYADETSHVELHVHHESKPSGATDEREASGMLVFVASSVFLGASTARTALAVDLRYAGNPRTSLTITSGTLRAGPFSGALTGDFSLGDHPHVRLHFASGAMACVDAIKAQAASYGAAGAGVAALAGMLGLDKAIEGRVSLLGDVEIDPAKSADHFSFRTQGDCKLSYLPSGL
jgi:hypothetical protein